MKKLAFGLVAVVLACAVVPAQQAADAAKGIVQSYLEIQAQLVADRVEDVKTPARRLTAQAEALGTSGEAIAKASTALERAADIKAAREAFGPLSDSVIAMVQADGSKELAADLRLAYCPMANRSWLQREEQIRNPYYGSQMANCGEFKPLKK